MNFTVSILQASIGFRMNMQQASFSRGGISCVKSESWVVTVELHVYLVGETFCSLLLYLVCRCTSNAHLMVDVCHTFWLYKIPTRVFCAFYIKRLKYTPTNFWKPLSRTRDNLVQENVCCCRNAHLVGGNRIYLIYICETQNSCCVLVVLLPDPLRELLCFGGFC